MHRSRRREAIECIAMAGVTVLMGLAYFMWWASS